MIDIHCHILPLLDDGPEKMSEAVAMARMAAEDGITHIVATPHVNENYTLVEEDALALCFRAGVDRLRERLSIERVPVGILPGAEIFYTNAGNKRLLKLGMNNTAYLLIEFPHTHLPADAAKLIQQLVAGDYYPIIAHAERNPSIIRSPRRLLLLRNLGALVQITADSLTGFRDRDTKQCALCLLKNGLVDFIASDAHSVQFRPPILSRAYELVSELVSERCAEILMRDNATAMLRGDPVTRGGDIRKDKNPLPEVEPSSVQSDEQRLALVGRG